jgi:hypothetical protein
MEIKKLILYVTNKVNRDHSSEKSLFTFVPIGNFIFFDSAFGDGSLLSIYVDILSLLELEFNKYLW